MYNEDELWDDVDEGDEAPSDIDQIIDLWLQGIDVSDMPVWEAWEDKYEEEEDGLDPA